MIGTTITIGGLITLIGSGFFIFTDEVGALGALVVGVVVMALGFLMRNPERTGSFAGAH